MHWLVYHVVSGQAFFTGVGLLIAGAAAAGGERGIYRRLEVLGLTVGGILVVVSSTPIPYGFYALATAATAAWVVMRIRKKNWKWVGVGFAAVWLGAAAWESGYLWTPTLERADARTLAVVGDSVTAGLGGSDKAETWPNILAREHGLAVQDLSQAGDTAGSAFQRLRTIEVDASVVVVEIGGNDVLGSTTCAEFSMDLDSLLGRLTSPDRQIVMFELPLPPFHHEYGRIQRTLAARHGVLLVPKRRFLTILSSGDATLDSIHLSPSGHRLMASCVWRLVQPAFADSQP